MDKLLELGETCYPVIHYFNLYTKSFDDNVETAIRSLLQRKQLLTVTRFFDVVGKFNANTMWCIKLSNSGGMNACIEELNQFKDDGRLVSLAAALERLLFCGISFDSGSMVFTQQSDPADLSILAKMNETRKLNKFCDVTVAAGDICFGAHKAVLAASSEYFVEMLKDNSSSLTIDVVDPDTFSDALDFMYTGNIKINRDNVKALSDAAATFLLPKLSTLCKLYEDIEASASRFPDVKFDPEVEAAANSLVTEEEAKIKRSKPVSIYPVAKRCERKAKQNALATITHAFDVLKSVDAGTESDNDNNDKPNSDEDYSNDDGIVNDVMDFPLPLKKRNCVNDTNETGGAKHVCPTCNATFSQNLTYRLHLLCHDDTGHKHKFKENRKKRHPNRIAGSAEITVDILHTYVCDICNRKYSSAHNLASHMMIHNKPVLTGSSKPKPSHTCNICDKTFRSQSHLTRHMITHTGERKHCCTTCGKLFLKADHLKRHERIHTSERPFTCEECGKTFRDKDHLKRHHLSHSDERPYFCEICGKQFKDKSTLLSHQKNHSATSMACPVCGRLFKTAGRLAAHTAKHAESKPHICEVCGKKFPFHGRLRKHMLSHTGARPFHCETCGKQFRDRHSLRLHQKKHTGIGLHPCPECGKQFTNPFHLKRHERVHTGEKPHKCDLCKKTFARVDNLEVHKRTCAVKQNFPSSTTNLWNGSEVATSTDEQGLVVKEVEVLLSSSSRSTASNIHTSAHQTQFQRMSGEALTANQLTPSSCSSILPLMSNGRSRFMPLLSRSIEDACRETPGSGQQPHQQYGEIQLPVGSRPAPPLYNPHPPLDGESTVNSFIGYGPSQ